jgi:hypothetical protein
MLRLVHPAPGGQGSGAPARRKGSRSPALMFTPEEARAVRTCLKNTATRYGGFDVLAAAMGVPVDCLYQAAGNKRCRRPSGILAIRLAAAAGITVEAMLSAKLAAVPPPVVTSPGGVA